MIAVNERVSDLIRPGVLGEAAAAGLRRTEFDHSNEALLAHRIPVDYVFIGDSITHYWDLPCFFKQEGPVLVNRGISGDVSRHVWQRFEADVIQLKPRFTIILIGVNNFKALDGWLPENGDPVQQIAEAIVADVRAMTRRAQEKGIVPVICSIAPTNRPDYAYDKLRNEGIRTANAKLSLLSEEEAALFVDYHSQMATEEGDRLREGLTDDGVHPHLLGYRVMARLLRERLAQASALI